MKRMAVKGIFSALLGISVLTFVACQKEEETICPAIGISAFDKLSPETVIARVGDETLTKRDVHDTINLMAKLTLNVVKKGVNEDQVVDRVRRRVSTGILETFERREKIYSVTSTNITVIPPSFLEASRAKFLGQFMKKGEDPLKLESSFTKGEARQLDILVTRDASLKAYERITCSNLVTVTEAEISNTVARIAEWNRIIAETNAFAEVTATNILRWVKEGHDFGDLATVYSRPQSGRPEPKGLVEEAVAVDFCNGQKDYLEEILQMKEGSISRVLEVNEGLEIVKLLKAYPEKRMCRVQRIVLPKGMPYREMTREQIIAQGEREGRSQVQRMIMSAVRGELKVDYPFGKDLLGGETAKRNAQSSKNPMNAVRK